MVIYKGSGSMNIEKTLEAGRVMRYHAAPIDKKQSVAEHSWGVAMILMEICKYPSKNLLKYAIMHDAAEFHTGDLPAPIKKANRQVKDMFDDLEEDGFEILGLTLPDLTVEEHRYLKIADCLEGMYYCESRIQAGDNAAIPVRDRYVIYLNKLNWNVKEMCDDGE